MPSALPHTILDVRPLEDLLSEPPDYLVNSMRDLDGDVLVLGVAGKMGPTLARMAKRASDHAGRLRRVIGVARFSDSRQRAALEATASKRSVAISWTRQRSIACPTPTMSSSWRDASSARPGPNR